LSVQCHNEEENHDGKKSKSWLQIGVKSLVD
jgi:hypothetical protein